MNICFVTIGHVSRLRGGVDRVTDTLAKAFMTNGQRVYMVSLWQPVKGDTVEDYQYFLPSQDECCSDNHDFMSKLFADKEIDVIVYQSESTKLFELLVATKGKRKLISVIHTDPALNIKNITDTWDKWRMEEGFLKFTISYPYWWLRKMYQYYTRYKFTREKLQKWYYNSDAVVLLSEGVIPVYQKLAKLTDTRKLHAISNPINYPEKISAIEEKNHTILFVGRLTYQKRLDRLLRVWKVIKDHGDWRILVLGEGDYLSEYKSLCKKWSLKDVDFKGQVNPDGYYKKASILCLTSTHEGFSMVVLEALLQNVIPIAFDSYEAVHDLIDNGENGILVPAFSIEQYKSALCKLIREADTRIAYHRRIQVNNREKKFDSNEIAKKWLNLFAHLN